MPITDNEIEEKFNTYEIELIRQYLFWIIESKNEIQQAYDSSKIIYETMLRHPKHQLAQKSLDKMKETIANQMRYIKFCDKLYSMDVMDGIEIHEKMEEYERNLMDNFIDDPFMVATLKQEDNEKGYEWGGFTKGDSAYMKVCDMCKSHYDNRRKLISMGIELDGIFRTASQQ